MLVEHKWKHQVIFSKEGQTIIRFLSTFQNTGVGLKQMAFFKLQSHHPWLRESSFNMEKGGGGHEDIEGGPEILGTCVWGGGGGSEKMIGSQGGRPIFSLM